MSQGKKKLKKNCQTFSQFRYKLPEWVKLIKLDKDKTNEKLGVSAQVVYEIFVVVSTTKS